MSYIPHEKLIINWTPKGDSFMLSLPWLSMEIDVDTEDKSWILDATDRLHSSALNQNVQKFINEFKDYPIFYIQPRNIEEFQKKDLQSCTELTVDSSTPSTLMETFGCYIANELKKESISAWTWDWDKILSKARVPGTNLYDGMDASIRSLLSAAYSRVTLSGHKGFYKTIKKGHPYHDRL